MIDERKMLKKKKKKKTSPPAPAANTAGTDPTLIQISKTPEYWDPEGLPKWP